MILNPRLTKSLLSLAAIAVLAGCNNTLPKRNARENDAAEHMIKAAHAHHQAAVRKSESDRLRDQMVPIPYIAGSSVPISREVNMPEQLRRSVPTTAIFRTGPVDFLTALNQIEQASGITITATPDALMPPGAFAARTSVESAPVQGPAKITLLATNVPLWKLLDNIAAQAQVSWRPTTYGAEFFRVETRTFELMTIPQNSGTTSSLGRGSASNNAFSADSKTTFTNSDSNFLDGLKSTIDPLLTKGGKFVVVRENQTLVVTDTPEALKRVEDLVRKENARMSRRVRLVLEAIEVTSKDGLEYGVDWNLLYNTTSMALSMSTPSSTTTNSNQAGTVGFQNPMGAFAGSTLAIKALNDVGRVTNRRVFPIVTLSGRPVSRALSNTFNYVDQVQTTATMGSSNSNVVQAPTVTQKDETVGTLLTLVPHVKTDGSIMVSTFYDVKQLDSLKPYTTGSGAAAVTVQQKNISGTASMQEVLLKPGRTEILGGLEAQDTSTNNRSLGEGLPSFLGGSSMSTKAKTVTVLLLTASVEEGF